MTITRVKPAGWAFGERLTSTQANALDVNITKAIDGEGGGAYELEAPLSITGDTVTLEDLEATDAEIGNLTVTGVFQRPAENALYTISGSSVADNSLFTLASSLTSTGFSLSSNEVQVPRAGRYLALVNLTLSSSSTTNPLELLFQIRIGGSGAGNGQARRFSATTTDTVSGSIMTVLNITTPASQQISVANASGVSASVSIGRLSLLRIS
jgi:hypothetical protein